MTRLTLKGSIEMLCLPLGYGNPGPGKVGPVNLHAITFIYDIQWTKFLGSYIFL